jgi:hypothetical protein
MCGRKELIDNQHKNYLIIISSRFNCNSLTDFGQMQNLFYVYFQYIRERNSIDVGPKVFQSGIIHYLLELLHLDLEFSENQCTILIHLPVKHTGLYHSTSEITFIIENFRKYIKFPVKLDSMTVRYVHEDKKFSQRS